MAAVLSAAAPASLSSTLAMPDSVGLAPALLELPPNTYFDTPGVAQQLLRARYREPEPARSRSRTPPRRSTFVDPEKADLPFLIAQFGSASSTTWLESRYKIWRGETSTDEAPRIQGFLENQSWVFAWGDPICLENAEEMKATAAEMWAWAKKQKRHLVWCCISDSFAEILAGGIGPKGKKWATLSCIREDVLRESTLLYNVRSTSPNPLYNLRFCLTPSYPEHDPLTRTSAFSQTLRKSSFRARTSSRTSVELRKQTSPSKSSSSTLPPSSPTRRPRSRSRTVSKAGGRIAMDARSLRWVSIKST